MIRSNKLHAVLAATFLLAACQTVPVNPERAKIASDIPIADLHMHPDPKTTAAEASDRMDRNGVRWAGAGDRGARRATWVSYSKKLGDRFIAFAGQTELNIIFEDSGIDAMLDANNPGIQKLYAATEKDLKAGRIKGIGEIFINNRGWKSGSDRKKGSRRKGRTDAPSMRLFFALIGKYDGFLTFHMHADPDSVEQLERLLASDRRGRILWNHCGTDSTATEVRPLLARNPNLFCELSKRSSPPLKRKSPSYAKRKIFDSRGVNSDWLELIEDFPDRFMIGTDVRSRSGYDGAIETVRRGLLPYLRPATARKVAYENAQRLFGLKMAPGS
jgi:hypothetical protein